MFTKNGIVQKTITLHDWKMIACCKGYCRTVSRDDMERIDIVQEYLMEEHLGNSKYLNYGDLYIMLFDTICDVHDKIGLRYLFRHELLDEVRHIEMFENRKELYLKDLCELFVSDLAGLQVREKFENDIYTDLFIIDDGKGKMMTIDEAEHEWLGDDYDKIMHPQSTKPKTKEKKKV